MHFPPQISIEQFTLRMVDDNTKPVGEMVGILPSTIAFTSPLQDMKLPPRDLANSKKCKSGFPGQIVDVLTTLKSSTILLQSRKTGIFDSTFVCDF